MGDIDLGVDIRRQIYQWRADRARDSACTCEPIGFSESGEWALKDGELRHRTGRFFSLVGVRTASSVAGLDGVCQPFILQTEIGILGFLLQHRDGLPYLLVQAKVEPGNIGYAQLAPTVQATQSNYERVHGGLRTLFLDWFLGDQRGGIIDSCLQSEQGSRFLGKFNRNMLVRVPDGASIPHSPSHRWIEAAQLLDMVGDETLVNSDARSVLAFCDWRQLVAGGSPFARWRGRGGFGEALLHSYLAGDDVSERSIAELQGWITGERSRHQLNIERIPLDKIPGWRIDDHRIIDAEDQLFAVQQFRITARDREVQSWDQPLINSMGKGLAALLCQRRNGILHFLLHAAVEAGNSETAQLTATVQIPPQGRRSNSIGRSNPFLAVLDECGAAGTPIRSTQSEEGGRFFRDLNEYSIVEIPEDRNVAVPGEFQWATLCQIKSLLRQPGIFTNEARSVISLMLSYL